MFTVGPGCPRPVHRSGAGFPQEAGLAVHRAHEGGWSHHGPGIRREPTAPPPHPGRRRRGRPHPPAQPRGRGVRPRRHAPLPGRHRPGHGGLHRRGLLQDVPRLHLRGHHLALRPGGAGRLGDRDRGAPPTRAARLHWRHLGLRHPPGQHPVGHQRRVLRQDRRGAGPAAPAGLGGRGDLGAGLLGPLRRHPGPRPGREPGLRRGPAACRGLHDLPQGSARAQPRPPRAALRAVREDHWPGHRLRRPGRAAGRPPALQPGGRRRPARHGQDRLRPGHGGQRRGEAPRARPAVLAGDEPHGADPAPAQLRGPGGRRAHAHRPIARRGLAQDRPGHQPPE